MKRVDLREDAPALALRGIAMAQRVDLVQAKALVRSAARIADCKALALEPNPAGRRWLERKAALLVTR